ncbi:hypothetical protein KBD20_00460 [Candidatus Saccharibacteria bacterium]|nr:hypothetical protein [Candidatus Saccharibacteria bacterium]
MLQRVSLSDVWNGKTDSTDLSGIALLIPAEVDDTDMNCGGRENLDARLRLRSAEKEPLPCGECAVKSVCTLGAAMG